MKRKTLSLFLAGVMAFSMAPAVMADPQTFSSTMKGFKGDVTVSLTVDGDQLTDVTVTGDDETIGIGQKAVEIMPQRMMEANSVDVDTVSGATVTSRVILACAADALSQSGATLTGKELTEVTVEDADTDILVVGGGITGISAAITAADAGKDVILLEKTDILGGAATTSHSSVWAVGSELTKDKYDFTADEIYEFFNKQAGPVYSKDVFYALANESLNSLHFLENQGVNFTEVSQCNPQADPRFWCSASENYGIGMMQVLRDALAKRDVDVRMATKADSLIQDADGAVTGVVAETKGKTFNITADAVILSTGGIGHNEEMCKEYVPGYENLVTNNTFPGATGDGQNMGVEAGGFLVGSGSMGVGTHATLMDHSTFGNGLLVNVEGDQVGAANEHYTKLYKLVAESSNGKLYSIFPSDIEKYSHAGNVEQMETNYKNGELYKADTVEELADQMGIDKEELMKTVEKYNAQCGAGNGDDFNTPLDEMCPIVTGPFYGEVHESGMIGTITGLAVNDKMQVVREDSSVIPNLYAAGELIYGDWFEGGYPMSGTGLGGCVSSGRIAVANATGDVEEMSTEVATE